MKQNSKEKSIFSLFVTLALLYLSNFQDIQALNFSCDININNWYDCKIDIDGNELNVTVILQPTINITNENQTELDDCVPLSYYRITTWDVYQCECTEAIEQTSINEVDGEANITEYFQTMENLQKIQLEHQNLTGIKSYAFSDATSLEEIDLDYNQILFIEDNAFIDLQNLTFLSLSKNNLTSLRSNIFAGAVSLQRLHLNHNKIVHIENGALSFMQLEVILLQNNRLKSLNNAMFVGALQLKEIVLEENELTRINNALQPLHHLRILILDYNRIEDINMEKFAALHELMHVSFRRSGIQFSDEMVNLNASIASKNSSLEVIDLADNELPSNVIRHLRFFNRLEIINLEFNDIRYLEHVYEIRKYFPFLKILNLGFNPIECKWVEEFGDFFKLREIKVIYDYCESDD